MKMWGKVCRSFDFDVLEVLHMFLIQSFKSRLFLRDQLVVTPFRANAQGSYPNKNEKKKTPTGHTPSTLQDEHWEKVCLLVKF